MKLQWKSVSPEQERRNSLLHGYRSLIGGLGETRTQRGEAGGSPLPSKTQGEVACGGGWGVRWG